VVYYVMALALWREAPLEEVLRVVFEGLQVGWGAGAARRCRPASPRSHRRARGWGRR